MRRIRTRLTYANVMSTLAVVLAVGGGTAYAVATIGSAEVINESLRGVDIKNRSLLGEDLGVRVRGERQVDTGPAALCGQGPEFDECVTVFFNVPRAQRLLLVGSGEWVGRLGGDDPNSGECGFTVGNVADLGLRKFGETSTAPSNPFNLAMNSVTPVLDQGGYEIAVSCRDTSSGTGGMTVKNTELSVVAIGDG